MAASPIKPLKAQRRQAPKAKLPDCPMTQSPKALRGSLSPQAMFPVLGIGPNGFRALHCTGCSGERASFYPKSLKLPRHSMAPSPMKPLNPQRRQAPKAKLPDCPMTQSPKALRGIMSPQKQCSLRLGLVRMASESCTAQAAGWNGRAFTPAPWDSGIRLAKFYASAL